MALRHKSAIKQLRASKKRKEHNVAVRSRLKSLVKNANQAIQEKNPETVQSSIKTAVSELQRYSTRGVLHKNAAARKISRLMKKANKAQTA
jgi:small subunit ribosomal protein S20